MAPRSFIAIALLVMVPLVGARTLANPIRKVVTMLQMMQEKVTKEGEKEKELYHKFMCYCEKSGGTLEESIAAAEAKGPQVSSDLETAEARKVAVAGELKEAQSDRSAAKAAMAEAKAIREKEAAAFAAETGDLKQNIAAIGKAVAALENGMGASFLQNAGEVRTLQRLVNARENILESDRQELLSFLSATDGYAPQSGEVTGILKQLGDTMSASLADATAKEEDAISTFDALMTAKKKEIVALTAAIESKIQEIGDLGVKIVELKNDLSETQKSLIEDKKFLAELKKGCSTKKGEYEAHVKVRSEEQVALADTIKVLNDDDALELFKKTLPSPSASFMQMKVTSGMMRSRALALLRAAGKQGGRAKPQIDLIALALHGKEADFGKIITMIDDMVALLKKEQTDDGNKKEYCEIQFDESEDTQKVQERKLADQKSAIASAEESIATLADEIKALEDGIKALDKQVADATEQRKEENAEFKELMASDSAAKQLLGFAKNRLYKFYNPKLYKPPAKVELSKEDRIVVEMGGSLAPTPAPGGIAGTGISFAQVSAKGEIEDMVAPPPPPETYGAYAKKSQESTGVIGMIDLLVKDLDKEMTEAKVEEADAQADYEAMMKDSAEKRTMDSQTLTSKEGVKADTEAALAEHKEKASAVSKDLAATLEYIASLHSECDWLIKYFDTRKEARDGEIESLTNAKAVLSGADYSLLQMHRGARGLRRRGA